MNVEKVPILESFHFGNNVVVDLIVNADFKSDAEICLEKDFVVLECLANGLNVETKSHLEAFLL